MAVLLHRSDKKIQLKILPSRVGKMLFQLPASRPVHIFDTCKRLRPPLASATPWPTHNSGKELHPDLVQHPMGCCAATRAL